jgi:hypothetical protein
MSDAKSVIGEESVKNLAQAGMVVVPVRDLLDTVAEVDLHIEATWAAGRELTPVQRGAYEGAVALNDRMRSLAGQAIGLANASAAQSLIEEQRND